MDLSGQTALVTGGARGIGRELTRQLTAQYAHVIAVGRDQAALDELAAELGDAVTPVRADLTRAADIERIVGYIANNHNSISILINNAATQTEMDFFAAGTIDCRPAIRSEIALNLEAAISLTLGLLPMLRAQPRATIVNITSGLAVAPKRAAPVYCATKAGLQSFTRAMRYQCAEQAPHIQVTEAILALVDTDMTRGRGKRKISPFRAAREIVAGIENDRDEVWVANAALLPLLTRLSPALVARMLK